MVSKPTEPRLRLAMADLPVDLLAAIGEVTVVWGYVQNLMEVAIWGMRGQTVKVGHATTAPLAYRKKMAMFRSVGREFLKAQPEVLADFEKLAEAIDEKYSLRNDVEHATWSHFGDAKGPSVSVRALRDGSIRPKFSRAADVDLVAQQIIKLVMELDGFSTKHIPPPQRSIGPDSV